MNQTERLQIKYNMVVHRGGEYATCDSCGSRSASDMHEMVPRSAVGKNAVARELIFNECICALLCRECHENIFGKEPRAKVWRRLDRLYTSERIKTHLSLIIDYSKAKDIGKYLVEFEEAVHE